MSCESMQDYIMKYYDKEANDIEEKTLKNHLKSCPVCNEAFSSLGEVLGFVESGMELEPPENFEQEVMLKVKEVDSVKKKKSDRVVITIYASVALLMSITAVIISLMIRNIGLNEIFTGISSMGSVTEMFFGSIGTLRGMYDVFTALLSTGLQVALMFLKEYYYVFIVAAAIVIAIEYMAPGYIKRRAEAKNGRV